MKSLENGDPAQVSLILSHFTRSASLYSWIRGLKGAKKMMVNVQKRLKGVSVKVDFWHGKYIDHAEAPFMVKLDF